MNAKELVNKYLKESYMMQLATVSGSQPWICTVYYVLGEDNKIYWLSLPSRRHSKEINNHSKVAVAIPIRFINGKEVVGIQIEGKAIQLNPKPEQADIIKRYANKFGRSKEWVETYLNNKTDHKLYEFTPKNIVLFDEVNFKEDPRQEYKVF